MTGATPAVSIVIATYNRAHLLPEAMESVLGQDYPDLELLVVDDGSSDRTRKVLKRYARRHPPERFRYVRQDNAGQSLALNRGYGLARGELIGYLPDDDLLEPDAIRLQAQALVADPEAAIAYSGYRVIDLSGAVEDVVRPIEFTPAEALRLHETAIGPGGLVRRRALEEASGWPEGMRFIGDLVLWIDIGLRGRAIRIPEPLVRWRKHEGSVTLDLGAEHSREHLTAYGRALALDGLPDPGEADRAEGLRNACVWATIFGGLADTWPGERYFVCDLQRKSISAATAGWDLSTPPDWDAIGRAADLYRELVDLTVELAHARRPAPEPVVETPAGIGAAEAKLREVGAIPDADGSLNEVGEARMRLGLIEAAIAAGAATDPARNRFRIIDRERVRLSDDELATLEALGFAGSGDAIAAQLERLRGRRGEPLEAA